MQTNLFKFLDESKIPYTLSDPSEFPEDLIVRTEVYLMGGTPVVCIVPRDLTICEKLNAHFEIPLEETERICHDNMSKMFPECKDLHAHPFSAFMIDKATTILDSTLNLGEFLFFRAPDNSGKTVCVKMTDYLRFSSAQVVNITNPEPTEDQRPGQRDVQTDEVARQIVEETQGPAIASTASVSSAPEERSQQEVKGVEADVTTA